MNRVVLAAHAFGLCLFVHLAGEPGARDCCACRKTLCPTCKKSKERIQTSKVPASGEIAT